MIEHKHLHILLFLVASSSSSLPRATVAQSATQPVSPRTLHDSVNPSLAILVVVLFFVFFVTVFCSFYLRLCSEPYLVAGGADDCSSSRPGSNPEVLATFPMLVYSTIKDHKMGKEAMQCAVCLSEFRDYETLRLLPKCSHVFHPDCIDAWLASHVTCPVCRAKLKPDYSRRGPVVLDLTNAHHVFDESSVRDTEENPVVGVANEGRESANVVDGCGGKMNGSSKARAFGMLVRSHSTGHSLVEPGKNMERYTLRLSEEVRKQIPDEHGSMKRSVSYDVILQSEGFSRTGCDRSDGEGSSKGKKDGVDQKQKRWVLSMTPPFVSRTGAAPNAFSTGSGNPRFWASSSRPLLPL